MNSFLYTIKLFISIDKLNLTLYVITSFFIIPFTIIELFLTKHLVEMIQGVNLYFSFESTSKFLIYLILLLLFSSINSSLNANTITRLTEISLFQGEKKYWKSR